MVANSAPLNSFSASGISRRTFRSQSRGTPFSHQINNYLFIWRPFEAGMSNLFCALAISPPSNSFFNLRPHSSSSFEEGPTRQIGSYLFVPDLNSSPNLGNFLSRNERMAQPFYGHSEIIRNLAQISLRCNQQRPRTKENSSAASGP